MSTSLISRSDDLSALVDRGYRVRIRGGYLLVEGIPYIKEDGTIGKADIVSGLELAGDKTCPPGDHTVWWTGAMPYTADGQSMKSYLVCSHWDDGRDLGEGILAYMRWSRKPKTKGGRRSYKDYREKMETYVEEVAGQADSRRPGVLDGGSLGCGPRGCFEDKIQIPEHGHLSKRDPRDREAYRRRNCGRRRCGAGAAHISWTF